MTLGCIATPPFHNVRAPSALQKLLTHHPIGKRGKRSKRRRSAMLAHGPCARTLPLQQQRSKQGKRGQAAFLQEAGPVPPPRNRTETPKPPTATATAGNPWGRQRGQRWGFSSIRIEEPELSSTRSPHVVHKSGLCTNIRFSISVHLNNFQIVSTSPV